MVHVCVYVIYETGTVKVLASLEMAIHSLIRAVIHSPTIHLSMDMHARMYVFIHILPVHPTIIHSSIQPARYDK